MTKFLRFCFEVPIGYMVFCRSSGRGKKILEIGFKKNGRKSHLTQLKCESAEMCSNIVEQIQGISKEEDFEKMLSN